MGSWDSAEKQAENASTAGGVFLQLKNSGDTAVGAVCGDPATKEIVWIAGKSEPYDQGKHAGLKPSLRFSVNFWTKEGMKIWEMSSMVFKQLCIIKRKYGNRNLVEVTRRGTGMDTEYTILPDAPIDVELGEQIAKAELYDLDAVPVPAAAPPCTTGSTGSTSRAPWSSEPPRGWPP